MVTSSLVVIQHGKPPPIERTNGPVEPPITNELTITHFLYVNSLNQFVDHSVTCLADRQVLGACTRRSWSLWGLDRDHLVKHFCCLILICFGFYNNTLPLNNVNLLMFWKHLSYGFVLNYIAITFTLYNVLYDWWLGPGQSRSQAVILRVWILGV